MPHGLYRREGSQTWYVLLYHEGRRFRASTGTANKKEAQKFYDEYRAKVRAQSRPSATTWKDACISGVHPLLVIEGFSEPCAHSPRRALE